MFKKLLIIIFLLSSCSGGGGDDGSSQGSSSTQSSNQSSNGVVGARVLNGAIDASPVDLVSSLDGLVQTARFAQESGFTEISSGIHTINVFRTKSTTSPLSNTAIVQEGNLKHTFVLHGDRGDFGLRVNLFSEQPPSVPSGASLVRVIHGATGANQLTINSVASAPFGGVSEFIQVSPGQNTLVIQRAVDRVIFDTVSLNAEEGRAYSIFVAGEFGYFITSRILAEN